jgi:hypothetical protein
MKKLAVFVEGRTEQLFVEKLLEEAAGKKQICIVKRQAFGGQNSKRSLKTLQATVSNPNHRYFAQIVDCGTDNRVKSDVVDHYDGLVAAGFQTILAIRDVFPEFKHAEIGALRTGLYYRVKTKPIEPLFILGVMEIEAWFIAEHTHFQKIHPNLTVDLIKRSLGFDPRTDDIELRPNPALDLDSIYRLVGMAYKKNMKAIQRTVDILDYERIYLDLPSKFPDLKLLIDSIGKFLSH